MEKFKEGLEDNCKEIFQNNEPIEETETRG